MTVPLLSIVIVNYNTRDLLRDCLRSLQTVTLPHEVIVVDNASADNSAEMIRAEFAAVRLLAQDRNTWFCGGNNIGIAAASGEFVLLLNPDTVVHQGALETLVGALQADRTLLGCTAQLRYPDGTIQRTCSRIPSYLYLLVNHTPLGMLFPHWQAALNAHHWYADAGFNNTQARDVQVLPGSCALFPRNVAALDADLWLYFPEDDLARRHAQARFRFIPEATITHREKSSTRSWLATRVYFRDMMIYTRKHHGAGAAALLWALSRPLYWGMWLRQAR